MSSREIFDRVQQQLENSLPFVIYRKPNDTKITGFFQKNVSSLKIDFKQSGFVFAPFDPEELAYIIPSEDSEILCTEMLSDPGELQVDYDDEQILYLDNTIENYIELLKNTIKAINTTILEKVVISRDEEIDMPSTSSSVIFKRLVHTYPKAFTYYWHHPETGGWLGATPESLFCIKDSKLSTMSLAGTQPYRGSMKVEWTAKEIREQQIVTDFIVSQLDPIVKGLSIGITETVRAGGLLHLRSLIEGMLDSEINSIESIIKALYPSPAICGMPKKEAGDFILAKENYDRSFYSGYLGELNMGPNKASNLFINLRCMRIQEERARLYAGGGITKDSDPMTEWEETVEKMKTMRRVIAF